MFATELEVEYHFAPILDLASTDAATYAGNPALKLPILVTEGGTWFGSVNICRELARRAHAPQRVVWPEDHRDPRGSNALEITLQGMATEVTIVMQRLAGAPEASLTKLRHSMEQSVAWLDANIDDVLTALPAERALSILELALFCFATHLQFRQLLSLDAFPRLGAFCERYGQRPAALCTAYRFDPTAAEATSAR
jgi:glutathione S-transferase